MESRDDSESPPRASPYVNDVNDDIHFDNDQSLVSVAAPPTRKHPRDEPNADDFAAVGTDTS